MSIQADITFERELWETAVTLRGTVAPGDYKHYVLPLLFLRYLSLGYEQRHQQLELMLKDQRSEYFTGDPTVDQEILEDPVEYDAANVFVVPEEASWDTLRRHAAPTTSSCAWTTPCACSKSAIPRCKACCRASTPTATWKWTRSPG